MNRKAALVGCREGQWVRTAGMQRVQLRAQVHETTMIVAEQMDGSGVIAKIVRVGPGVRELQCADWTRVSIVDGPHHDALCFVEEVA